MICNLNQMSFQEYGVIHPERGPEARRSKDLPNTQFLSLTQGPVQVYYTRSDTWICCRDGATVLSVSLDNRHYAHYYLDKPVYVKPGVYFCLSPFLGESTAEFSASMLLGLALGVFYDALRALRRLRARLTLPLDVLFALTFAAALLLFALYPGRGLFRLFAFAGLVLGAGLYFLTLSPILLRVYGRLYRIIGGAARMAAAPVGIFLHFVGQILKTLFASVKKWVTILGKIRRKRSRERSAAQNEVCQIIAAGEADPSDRGGVCYRYPGVAAPPDHRKTGRGGAADKQHHLRRAGKQPADRRHRKH